MPYMSTLDADHVIKLAADETNGALRVNVVATTATAASDLVDDSAFTPGVSTVNMIGASFDDVAPDSVNEGDGGGSNLVKVVAGDIIDIRPSTNVGGFGSGSIFSITRVGN